jgi:branched-chain amino acid transport system ATP-binding protein
MSTQGRAHLGQARSFQINTLFPTLTVLDNMLLAVHGLKSSRYQMFRANISYKNHIAKAKDLLELIGLWQKREELAQDISYGEQRKMEIALSLASEPRLMLLDEPSAGLTAEESADLVKMINHLGWDFTVLVVAHDMDLVFGLADRIIVLHYGRIIVEGSPEEIQEDSRVKEIYMGIEEGA